MKDPRPDLTSDSKQWTRLLQLAEKESPNLPGILHGFRCEGTRIKKGQKGYALRPDIDPAGDSAWISKGEYDEEKQKWLNPYQRKIIRLLEKL